MINQFYLIGRVYLLCNGNQLYPGIYLELLETKELVPVSFNTEVLKSHLNLLSIGDVVGIKGRVAMDDTQIILIAERVTIISRTVGNIIKEVNVDE